ncbi:uncharacterized protein TNCT_556151 [Trichonephila clavata]|uniref:PWWP domain-containing protein n=1 Tax=Trichonephila clavata TaxID=2740835 RepID=A0A8X6HT75_TRICU|nr:uncharacterized protein TNCT_556151 [Trichonephila clavata]
MEPSEQPEGSGDLIVSPTSPERIDVNSVMEELQPNNENVVEVTSEECIGIIPPDSGTLILSADATIEFNGKQLVFAEGYIGDELLVIVNEEDVPSFLINSGLQPNHEIICVEDGREIVGTHHNPLYIAQASSESGYSTSSNLSLESLDNVSYQVQLGSDTAEILLFPSTSEGIPSEDVKGETKDETKHDKLLQLAVVAQDLQITDIKNSESVNMACTSDLGNGSVPDSVSISHSNDASAVATYLIKEKDRKEIFCQENAPYQTDISTLTKKEISSLSASVSQMTIVNAVTSVHDQNFEKASESNGFTKEQRLEENSFDKNHIEKIEELGKISSAILINENYMQHSNEGEITDCKLSNKSEKNISPDCSKTAKSSFDKNHFEKINKSGEISSVILTNENYMQHSNEGKITHSKFSNKSENSVPSNHPNSEKSNFDKNHLKKIGELSKISSVLLTNENYAEHSNIEVTNYMLSNGKENSVPFDCLNSMKEINQSIFCGKGESFTIESNKIAELSNKENSSSETCIDTDEKINADICNSVDFSHKLSSNENMCEEELKDESNALSNDMNELIDTNINEDLYAKNEAFVSKKESQITYSEIVETTEINSCSETATPSLKESSNSKDFFNKNKRKCVIDEYEFENSSSSFHRKINHCSSLENQCTEILNSSGDISTEIDVTKISECTYSESKSEAQNLSFRGALTLVSKKNYNNIYGVEKIHNEIDKKVIQDDSDERMNYDIDEKINQDSINVEISLSSVNNEIKLTVPNEVNHYNVSDEINKDSNENEIHHNCIGCEINEDSTGSEINKNSLDNKMSEDSVDEKVSEESVDKINENSADDKTVEDSSKGQMDDSIESNRKEDSTACKINKGSVDCEMNKASVGCEMHEVSANCEMNEDGANCKMNESNADGEMNEGSADWEMNESSADGEINEGSTDSKTNHNSDGKRNKSKADNKIIEDNADGKMNQDSANSKKKKDNDHAMNQVRADVKMIESNADSKIKQDCDIKMNQDNADSKINEDNDCKMNQDSADDKMNVANADSKMNKHSADGKINYNDRKMNWDGADKMTESKVYSMINQHIDVKMNQSCADDEANESNVDSKMNQHNEGGKIKEDNVNKMNWDRGVYKMNESNAGSKVNKDSDIRKNQDSFDNKMNQDSADGKTSDGEMNEGDTDVEVNGGSADGDTDEGNADSKINQDIIDSKMNQGIVHEVNEGSVDDKVNEGSVDEEVNEGSVDEGCVDEEVNEGSVDEEVKEGSVDDEVNEDSVDVEVNEGSVDDEVNEGSADDEVNEDSDDDEVNEGNTVCKIYKICDDDKINNDIADNKTDADCADDKMNEGSAYSKIKQDSAHDKITQSKFDHKMNKDNVGKMNQDSAEGKVNEDRANDKINHINMENVANCGSMDDEISFSIMKDKTNYQNVGDKINGINVVNKINHATVSGIINRDSLGNETKCSNVMNEVNHNSVGVKRNLTENVLNNKSIENYNNSSTLFEDLDDESIFNRRNKRTSYLAAIQKSNFEKSEQVNKNELITANMVGIRYNKNINSDEKIGSAISNSAVFDEMSFKSTETIFNMDSLTSDLMIPEGTSVQPPERTYVRKKPSLMIRKTNDIGLFSNDELSDSSYSFLREDNSKESTNEDVKHLNSETVEDEDYLVTSNVESKVIATYKNKRRSSQRCIKKKIKIMNFRSDLNPQNLEPEFVEDPETAGWGAYLLGTSFKPTNTEDVPETPSINVEQEKVPEKPTKKRVRPWFKNNSHKTKHQWAKMIKSPQLKYKATPFYKKKIEKKVKKQVENLCKSENLDEKTTPVESSKKKVIVVRHVKARKSSASSLTSGVVKVCGFKVMRHFSNERHIPVCRKESERKSFSISQNSNNYNYSCPYCDYESNVANNIMFHLQFCLGRLQEDVIYCSNCQSSDVINNMDVRQRIRGEDFYLQLGENLEDMGESSESLSNASAVETLDDEEFDDSIIYQDGTKKKIEEAELQRQTKKEKVKKYGFADRDVIWAKVKHRFWPAIVWKIDEIETIIYLIGYPSKYVGLHLRTDSLKGQWRSFDDAKWNKKILEDSVRYKDNDTFVKAVQKCDSYTRKIFLDDVEIDPFDYFSFPRNRMLFMPEDVRNEVEEPLVPLQPQEMKELEMDELDEDNEKIVGCILDGCCDDHLVSVYQKEVSSERHEMYFNKDKGCSSRLKDMSWFAPFKKDPAMQIKLSDYFFDVFRSRIGDPDDMTPYINEVWIPEAIIKAISIVRNLDMDDAEHVFFKQGTENGISDNSEPMDVEETD